MFRHILSSRGLIVGLVFCVVSVGGSLLYSWHARRATEAELQRGDRFLQRLEEKNDRRTENTVRQPVEIKTPGFVNAPDENMDTPMPNETEVLPNETGNLDFTEAFEPDDFVSEAAEAEDVPVSPFGFGPYPEVPADYFGIPVWMQNSILPDHAQRNIELIDRVLIKLWQQGDKSIVGGSTYSGKIYPHYEDTVYIRWTESTASDGTPYRYISRRKGASHLPTSEEIENGDIPPGFKIIELDDAGYDPYTFLDLQ